MCETHYRTGFLKGKELSLSAISVHLQPHLPSMHTATSPQSGQAYLENTAGLLPDHRNKADIAITQVTHSVWFPRAYKSSVYPTL